MRLFESSHKLGPTLDVVYMPGELLHARNAQRTSSKDEVFVADLTNVLQYIFASSSHEYPIFHRDQCMVCLPSFTMTKTAKFRSTYHAAGSYGIIRFDDGYDVLYPHIGQYDGYILDLVR